MDVLRADQFDEPVCLKHCEHVGLDACKAERHVVGAQELVDLGQLGRALRVDEVDALEVEDERSSVLVLDAADPVLERFCRGEEQAAVETEDNDACLGLVSRILPNVAEDLGVGLATQKRHGGARCDVDQPAEREHDADHDAGEHAGREHTKNRSDGDPEIEPGHPVQTPQLRDVDHPEHHRIDDDRCENRLR